MKIYFDKWDAPVSITDNQGYEWIWGPSTFHVMGTIEEVPDSGYFCKPFDLWKALGILLGGGYVEEEDVNAVLDERYEGMGRFLKNNAIRNIQKGFEHVNQNEDCPIKETYSYEESDYYGDNHA